MNKIMIHTSWGHPQETLELAEGVWRVSTASHGGLKLSRERWEELPDVVRDSFITATFAEEDCEEPIAMTLLKLGNGRDLELALQVARSFPRYAPALSYLRATVHGPHYHVISYWAGLCTDPFERFDTRIEAESFVGDAEMVEDYGKMEAVECNQALPRCRI